MSRAEAQTSTVTPTVEYLFSTKTPAPTRDLRCPVGTPIGYGTVTPDISWRINCGNCLLTSVPRATSSFVRTPTPCVGGETECGQSTPGATPTVTSTPMPVPPPTYFLSSLAGYGEATQVNSGETLVTIHAVEPATLYWWHPQYVTLTVVGYVLSGTMTGSGTGAHVSVQTGTGNYPLYASQSQYIDNGFKCGTTLSDGGAACRVVMPSYTSGSNGMIVVTYPMNTQTTVQMKVARLTSGSLTGRVDVYYIMSGVNYPPLPSPTPTVTPTATMTPTETWSSYCDVVNGGNPPIVDPVEGILPVPIIRTSSCVQIGGMHLDLSALNFIVQIPPVDVPGLNICIRGIEFGSVNFLGITFSIDAMALGMAAIAAVLLVRR